MKIHPVDATLFHVEKREAATHTGRHDKANGHFSQL
jgi:hypothetical protein